MQSIAERPATGGSCMKMDLVKQYALQQSLCHSSPDAFHSTRSGFLVLIMSLRSLALDGRSCELTTLALSIATLLSCLVASTAECRLDVVVEFASFMLHIAEEQCSSSLADNAAILQPP